VCTVAHCPWRVSIAWAMDSTLRQDTCRHRIQRPTRDDRNSSSVACIRCWQRCLVQASCNCSCKRGIPVICKSGHPQQAPANNHCFVVLLAGNSWVQARPENPQLGMMTADHIHTTSHRCNDCIAPVTGTLLYGPTGCTHYNHSVTPSHRGKAPDLCSQPAPQMITNMVQL
jgi:hypothetical protein